LPAWPSLNHGPPAGRLYKIITLVAWQKQESGKYALFHSQGTTPVLSGCGTFGNVPHRLRTFWSVLEGVRSSSTGVETSC